MNLKKIGEKFKINKTRVVVFVIIVLIAILFQIWDNSNSCLKLFCKPLILSISYYVVWLVEFLNLGVIMHLDPIRWILIIDRTIVLVLQIIYWYFISCLISILIDKKIESTKNKREEMNNKIQEDLNKRIKKDIESAEQLEKQRALNKNMKNIKRAL